MLRESYWYDDTVFYWLQVNVEETFTPRVHGCGILFVVLYVCLEFVFENLVLDLSVNRSVAPWFTIV